MLWRAIPPGYLAGAALAALAHTGLFTAVFLIEPSGRTAGMPADESFVVTLVEVIPEPAAPEPAPEPEMAHPPPEPGLELPPEPKPEEPEPALEEALGPPPEADSSDIADDPANPPKPEPDAPTASPHPAGPIEMVDESLPAGPEHPAEETSAAGSVVQAGEEGTREMDTYLREVRIRLARHAPKGVRGARDCEVEFQLSRAGEVVFVGIRTGSGSRLYDRRCLNAVTASVPYPAAPLAATQADLNFSIIMKQKR